MIPAYLYRTAYLAFVTVLSLLVFRRYQLFDQQPFYKGRYDDAFVFFIAMLIAFFIGAREPLGRYFGDSSGYYQDYLVLEGVPFSFSWDAGDPLFANFLAWAASMRLGINFVFTVVSILYFGLALWAIKRFCEDNVFAVFLVFLAAFSTFSFGTNGIRNGLATSVFLLALSYRDKIPVCISLALISLGIHHSMQLPIGGLVLSLFYKNSKFYFFFWILCLVCAMLHITVFQEIFASFTDESGANYLEIDAEAAWGGHNNFRLDFVLYSSVPIIIGYIALFKKDIELSSFYKNILNVYLITNGVWMLCMYASFTNRIAYLSWFLYPIVLMYPILNEDWGPKKYRVAKFVAYGHLAFTLFMFFIYY